MLQELFQYNLHDDFGQEERIGDRPVVTWIIWIKIAFLSLGTAIAVFCEIGTYDICLLERFVNNDWHNWSKISYDIFDVGKLNLVCIAMLVWKMFGNSDDVIGCDLIKCTELNCSWLLIGWFTTVAGLSSDGLDLALEEVLKNVGCDIMDGSGWACFLVEEGVCCLISGWSRWSCIMWSSWWAR